jgi:hypothetical protein
MNATRGINTRNKIYAAVLGSLLLLTAMFLTACGSGNSGTTNPGNANTGNANTGNGNTSDGNTSDGNAGGDGESSGTQVDYMYPAQGYVEVLQLSVDNAGDVTGSLYDVYNCGNGQSGTAPSPIQVGGTAPTDTTLDLQIEGESGDLQGNVVNQGLDLSNSSGSTLGLQLITASNSLSAAVSQQPAVDSISSHTCADLPATNEP